MARESSVEKRNQWYERQMELADGPRDKFEILRSKLFADVKRLPEELRDGAYETAVEALRSVIEGIGDAIEDSRQTGAYA